MRRLIIAFVVLFVARTGFAAQAPPSGASQPAPAVQAVRATTPIRVDGVLDEDVWKTAPPVTTLQQNVPDQGAAPRQRTEVRVAYDDQALYFGARLYDNAPDSVRAQLARRDNGTAAD